MESIIFAEQENAQLHGSSQNLRRRLKSVPEKLKSPMLAKTMVTPLSSGRKAFGVVGNRISTPAVKTQEKKLAKPQETKAMPATQTKVEEYPEVEQFIPYDPLEFQRYSVPEDLIPLGCMALSGLACFPHRCPDLDEEKIEELQYLSPVEMPECPADLTELTAFLQTIDELTELPSEPEF
ncbi:securin-like [Poecilia latipinna]|uniref:Securin n=2 Tax=Poecilia TaxID=8080 RepID=A0A3B3UT64_9TELE|nr:PREDICTED: securin-like [Poecilia mexicana]XP_014838299.1 PREDICTED: securin-like [Poecilia mexicana]XP_014878427.1 PREDICTED: securin-like [Poecilia latipinna]XP_014878428.1 PREDICTED: securin-like [Poecilia latipinna]XP_014884670.1 PREDICTED: securin-like [Poecilia latipinna]XP_014884671.1 PREDICTED: securin-like [Poecilia latipinna]